MVNPGALMAVAVLAFVFAADVGSLMRGDTAAEQAPSVDPGVDRASLGGRVHISFCGS
jgi:hypothetical protein